MNTAVKWTTYYIPYISNYLKKFRQALIIRDKYITNFITDLERLPWYLCHQTFKKSIDDLFYIRLLLFGQTTDRHSNTWDLNNWTTLYSIMIYIAAIENYFFYWWLCLIIVIHSYKHRSWPNWFRHSLYLTNIDQTATLSNALMAR